MITKNDMKYFFKARSIAKCSDYPKEHIGCIAVYHRDIIGFGYNSNKTHPTQKYFNKYRIISDELLPKIHAEIKCINQIRHMNINFKKVRLYTYRTRNDQPYGMSRPCPSCMEAIKQLGIREIYYTTNNGYACEKILSI